MGNTVALQNAPSLVTGGLVVAVVLFLVIVVLFVLVYARSLGVRARQYRGEERKNLVDQPLVIGRFPRQTVNADDGTKMLDDKGRANQM